MKKAIFLLGFCLLAKDSFACDHYPRKRNTATTVDFCLRALDGFAKVDATFADGDVKVMVDEAAEANIAALPTDEGSCYSLPLTAGELAGKRTHVMVIKNAAYYPKCLSIETYGDSTAQNDIPDTNLVKANGVATDAVAELSGPPGATPSLLEMVQWVYELMRFKITQTASTATAYKADSSTSLGTSSTSDDGTSFVRGKYN